MMFKIFRKAISAPIRLAFDAPDRPNYNLIMVVVMVLTIAIAFRDALQYGSDWVEWNWMYISGLLAAQCFLAFSLRTELKYLTSLQQLRRHSVLIGSDSQFNELDNRFRLHKKNLAIRTGKLFVVVQFLVLLSALLVYPAITAEKVSIGMLSDLVIFDHPNEYWSSFNWNDIGLIAACVLLAYLAGLRFGTLWAGGKLPIEVRNSGIRVAPISGHPDEAGGFRPWGDLYLAQAGVVAIPLAWIAAWWVIAGSLGSMDEDGDFELYYEQWRAGFIGLWILAAAFMNYAFISPIKDIHYSMRLVKMWRIEHDVPFLTECQSKLQEKLVCGTPAEIRAEVANELQRRAENLRKIEDFPV